MFLHALVDLQMWAWSRMLGYTLLVIAGCQQTMFDAWVTLVEHFQNSTMFLGAMGPMVMTNLVVM